VEPARASGQANGKARPASTTAPQLSLTATKTVTLKKENSADWSETCALSGSETDVLLANALPGKSYIEHSEETLDVIPHSSQQCPRLDHDLFRVP
jgi:hypothetical protein